MKRQVHPFTGIMVVAIVLVLVAFRYARQERQTITMVPAGQQAMMGPTQKPPETDHALGIVWQLSGRRGPGAGFEVTKLIDDPVPSRLRLAGVKEGDRLFYVIGSERQRIVGINRALDDLITRGKPFTLVLEREGQQIKLPVKTLGKKKVPTTDAILKMMGSNAAEFYGNSGAPEAEPGSRAAARARAGRRSR